MLNCGTCGSPVTEQDRFCGECGAHVAARPAGSDPPEAPERSDEAPIDPNVPLHATDPGPEAPVERSRKSPLPVLAAVLAGAGVLVGGGFVLSSYLAGGADDPQGEELAAQADGPDDSTKPGTPPDTPPQEPDEAPGAPGSDAPGLEKPKDDSGTKPETAALTPEKSGPLQIREGKWAFTWRINNITSTSGGATQTPRDSFDIGRSGSEQRCISRSTAQAPRSQAFPMDPRANCRVRSHTMSNGRLDSTFSCNFPKGTAPVEAAIVGDYDATSVDTIMRIRMPSAMIAARAYVDEMVDVYYSYKGRRSGSC